MLKKTLAMLVVLSLAGFASAGAIEDFESYSPGSLIGQGGWVTMYWGGNPMPRSPIVGNVGIGPSKGIDDKTSAFEGDDAFAAINIDAGDVPANGTYTFYSLLNLTAANSESATILIGDGLTSGPDSRNVYYRTFNTYKTWSIRQKAGTAGSYYLKSGEDNVNFPALNWFEMKFDVTTSGGLATAVASSYRDVNDTTGVGAGWTALTDDNWGSSGTMPVNNAGLISASGAEEGKPHPHFDNFGPVVPEPATMALLGFGGVLTLLRRRRRMA